MVANKKRDAIVENKDTSHIGEVQSRKARDVGWKRSRNTGSNSESRGMVM